MSFYADVICKASCFRTDKVVKDVTLLEPVTRAAVVAIIADAKAMGHDLRVLETFRSKDRQQYLFIKGLTKLKQVGVHHYGLACDLGLFDKDGYVGDAAHYRFLASLAGKHGLISGLDWGEPTKKHNFVDAGHVQRVAITDQPRLFAGGWYPEDAYTPHATLIAKA